MSAEKTLSGGMTLALVMGMLTIALTGCTREVILPGDRFDTRTPLADTFDAANSLGDATVEKPVAAPTARNSVAISLPATRTVSEWTHRAGSVQHLAPHAALSTSLAPVWATSIGAGDSRRHRISATPVAGGGRVFTLDSRATVSAVDAATGALAWSRDLTPAGDREDDASGGGLALSGGTLYVTSGFGSITALNAATGSVKWVQRLEAPATTPPTVEGGLVYVVTADAVARAIDIDDGKIVWTLPGAPNITGLVGGAGPAISGRHVILPLPSGEVIAALRRTGLRVWGTTVSGERLGRAYSIFTGITGDPVVTGGKVYVGSPQGRLIAVDAQTGERIWTAKEGAYGPVVPVGRDIFLVSDQGQLVRLNAATGETVWTEQLPYFLNEKPRRRRDVFAHFGPVLAGGRLLVASDDGLIRSFDPASGAQLGTVEISGGAATSPIVVNGVAYVVSTKGNLHAFR